MQPVYTKVLAQGEVEDDAALGPGRKRWVAQEATSRKGAWIITFDYSYQSWWYVKNWGKRLRGPGAREAAARLAPGLEIEEFVS